MAWRYKLKAVVTVFVTVILMSIFIQNNPKRVEEEEGKQCTIKKLKLSISAGKYEYFSYLKIPKLKEQTNKARIGHGTCLPEKNNSSSDMLEMVVVSNYVPIDILRHQHKIYGNRTATHEEEEARISEITSCYQNNLNHAYVKTLYIFVEHYESMVFLHTLNFKNSEKLVILWTNATITVKYTLEYISKCLQGHIVAMVHQDNRIGAGFDKIRPKTMIDNNLMYALTRQPPHESYCYYAWNGPICDVKRYQGSHDTFVFHAKEISNEALSIIRANKMENNDNGMENIIVWIFREKLGSKVINPCLVLHVHHEHCVPIRKTKRRRVNDEMSQGADVTDQLE